MIVKKVFHAFKYLKYLVYILLDILEDLLYPLDIP